VSQAAGAGNKDGRRQRRQYTADFKAEAVHLLRRRRAQGTSLTQVARELDVAPGVLCDWARKLDPAAARAAAGDGDSGGESVEDEVKRLRREVATLRQERDFAKKAAAFFLKESL